MSELWKLESRGLGLPALGTACAMVAAGGLFFLLLFTLARPTVYENPGLSAYAPPPATRLVPLPRESDAPELVDVAGTPSPSTSPSPSGLTDLAQAKTNEKPAKPVAHASAHKRVRAAPHVNDQGRWGYAQQNYDWHGWGNTRAAAGGRNWF
jgi:hypothetical protein